MNSMTVDEALDYGRTLLALSPTPYLDARLLLQHVLRQPHSYLVAHHNAPLTSGQEADYRQLLERARQQEPIPYLIGSAPFFDFELEVNPAVLIPRPETEQLVETAVNWATSHRVTRVADIGTGSGAIAIALARQLPNAAVEAVDLSPQALAVARRNAARLAPGRIQFYQGDLLTPLAPGLDGIVANLPYVTDGEWTALADGVKWYEPALALQGGPDGLDLIRRLLAQAGSKLALGGAVFLEIGWQQGTAVTHLAHTFFPEAQVTVQADFAGHDRIVVVKIGK
ncbi:MAG TPA: peptide chain release factor N(5)-glutamine methyltransferase [Chloroflexota bacterium]|nr:peptide chain release factor N(5)-glutamine methyltransferase [Chloroflexota bacterium]